jgi:hypothetical protein
VDIALKTSPNSILKVPVFEKLTFDVKVCSEGGSCSQEVELGTWRMDGTCVDNVWACADEGSMRTVLHWNLGGSWTGKGGLF